MCVGCRWLSHLYNLTCVIGILPSWCTLTCLSQPGGWGRRFSLGSLRFPRVKVTISRCVRGDLRTSQAENHYTRPASYCLQRCGASSLCVPAGNGCGPTRRRIPPALSPAPPAPPAAPRLLLARLWRHRFDGHRPGQPLPDGCKVLALSRPTPGHTPVTRPQQPQTISPTRLCREDSHRFQTATSRPTGAADSFPLRLVALPHSHRARPGLSLRPNCIFRRPSSLPSTVPTPWRPQSPQYSTGRTSSHAVPCPWPRPFRTCRPWAGRHTISLSRAAPGTAFVPESIGSAPATRGSRQGHARRGLPNHPTCASAPVIATTSPAPAPEPASASPAPGNVSARTLGSAGLGASWRGASSAIPFK